MNRTTVYLPDDLKEAIAREARRRDVAEAAIIREAIASAVKRPRPNAALFTGPAFAERADDALVGFGER